MFDDIAMIMRQGIDLLYALGVIEIGIATICLALITVLIPKLKENPIFWIMVVWAGLMLIGLLIMLLIE
jgi:hypothetical protein